MAIPRFTSTKPGRLLPARTVLPALAGGVSAGLFWLPLIFTPFVQEDLGFLREAEVMQRTGASWSRVILAPTGGSFWRPFSIRAYWYVVNRFLSGDSLLAHCINISCIVVAAFLVGLLATLLAFMAHRSDAAANAGWSGARAAFFSAFLYGIHGAFFLPAGWASAAQESMAIAWSALFLLSWCFLCSSSGGARAAWIACSSITLLFALTTKEGTVVLPLLALAIWFTARSDKSRFNSRELLLPLLANAAVLAGWLVVRAPLVKAPPRGSPYDLVIGANVFRNAAALLLYAFNLPREAIVLAQEPRYLVIASAWAAACVILQALSVIIFIRGSGRSRRAWILALVFAGIAIAPYLPLAWNCYPYYTLLSLGTYAYLVALCCGKRRKGNTAVMLAIASSLLLLAGEFYAPYPSLISRARWGSAARRQLKRDPLIRNALNQQQKIYVVVGDQNRFGALGSRAGIARELGVPDSRIVILESPLRVDKVNGRLLLTVDANGVARTSSNTLEQSKGTISQ
jgi:hypothetical protein